MDFYQDPFFCVPRSTHTTRQGKVELRIFYCDSTPVLIFFGCARQRMERLVPAGRFGPPLTWAKGRWWGDLRMRIGQSSHPMANRLHHLGLDQARPLCLWMGTRFQARLSQGVTLTYQVEME